MRSSAAPLPREADITARSRRSLERSLSFLVGELDDSVEEEDSVLSLSGSNLFWVLMPSPGIQEVSESLESRFPLWGWGEGLVEVSLLRACSGKVSLSCVFSEPEVRGLKLLQRGALDLQLIQVELMAHVGWSSSVHVLRAGCTS